MIKREDMTWTGAKEDHATVITDVDLTAQKDDQCLGERIEEARRGVRVWQDPFDRPTGTDEVLKEYEHQLEADVAGSESE